MQPMLAHVAMLEALAGAVRQAEHRRAAYGRGRKAEDWADPVKEEEEGGDAVSGG